MRIIHLLNWNLLEIVNELDNIKKQGFDTIQINPMQPFKETEGFNWWASYQPLDFKIGNMFGTKETLTRLCEEARKRNINIVVDVVCNHLANNGDLEPTVPNENIPSYLRDNKDFWKVHPKVGEFYTYLDAITNSIGLPGLNLKNKELQDIIFKYLEDLKECGVKGFRIDAAKHIGIPSYGVDFIKRLGEYCNNNNLFSYGEVLNCPKEILDEFAKYIYVLTENTADMTDKNKMVTHVESHDTKLNSDGNTRNIPYSKIVDQYSELTKNFENTIFYVRDKYKPFNPFGIEIPRKDYSEISIINDSKMLRANQQKVVQNNEKAEPENNKKRISKENENKIIMDIHMHFANKINSLTTLEECKQIALSDYRNQLYLAYVMGRINDTDIDRTLLNYVTHEIYTRCYKHSLLHTVSYNGFYNMCIRELEKEYDNNKFVKVLAS